MATQMLAIVAPKFTDPSGYILSEVPRPIISPDSNADATQVVIRVHAASINPVDVKLADGGFRRVLEETFPLRIGYDCSGVVADVGRGVTGLKVGDEVWSRLPEVGKGSLAEYVKCAAEYVAPKPKSLSFSDAASMPLAALTAMQALDKYEGSLEGKTVFVPAGLGGTGAYACQLAKNVHGAAKVITTVSTSKVDKIPQYLGEDVVDEIIDYTKQDPLTTIPHQSIDFLLDTMNQATSLLPLMVPQTGTIISISSTPSAAQLQNSSFFNRPDGTAMPKLPLLPRAFLTIADSTRKARAWTNGVKYSYMFLEGNGTALDRLRGYVDEGKIRPVVGCRTDMRDLEGVKEVCLRVWKGKGGVGKEVVDVVKE